MEISIINAMLFLFAVGISVLYYELFKLEKELNNHIEQAFKLFAAVALAVDNNTNTNKYILKSKKETPFQKGQKSFKEGNLDNPYNEDKDFWSNREWQRGWNTAYFQNLNS